MSAGPIEFGDVPADDLPASEYGGRGGLIQPSPLETGLVAADGMPIGHELTPSEARGVLARAAGEPVFHGWDDPVDASGGVVLDPRTGRGVLETGNPEPGADNLNVEGKMGKDHGLSDLKPGT